MKQQEVFKKIGVIIKELSDQYEYLKTIDGQLNELELELFIANSHFLTDHVVILNKLNALMPPAPKQAEEPKQIEEEKPLITEQKQFEYPHIYQEPKYFEPQIQTPPQSAEPIATITSDNQSASQIDLGGIIEDDQSYIRQEPETIRHELILDEADFIDDEDETDEIESIEEEPAEEIIKSPPAIAEPVNISHIEELKPIVQMPAAQTVKDTVKEGILTINEKISSQLGSKTANITEQAGVQKITDLKQAINLNDKLLYIKDLFNGYNLAYSEAIEILNRFSSFEEADTFLKKNYVVKNAWDSKPETTGKFYALLKRRYE